MAKENTNQSSNEVFVLGNEILIMLQEDHFSILELELKSRWGSEWFMDCSILDSNQKNELKNDLQFLLKQIIQKNNGNFRLALSKRLFREPKLTKSQLEALSAVQGFRNSWAHPDSTHMTLTTLRELAFQILNFYGKETNPLVDYCSFILKFQKNDDEAIPRILANSVLFRRHVEKVDNLVHGMTENVNLLAQITQLKDTLKNSKERYLEDNDLIPDYENIEFKKLQDSLVIATHIAISFFKAYYYLNMAVAQESLKTISIAKKLSKSKKIKILIDDFEATGRLEELMTKIELLKEASKELDSTLEDCLCEFCTNYKKMGIISDVHNLTEISKQIVSVISKIDL